MRTLKLRDRLHKVSCGHLKKAERFSYQHFQPDAVYSVTLRPNEKVRGCVLMAHVVEPFPVKSGSLIPTTRTHFCEAWEKALSLLDLGFAVDSISYRNAVAQPRRKCSVLVSSRVNFERLAKNVGKDRIKILDLDIAHWLFNDTSAPQRPLDLQKRKKKSVNSFRRFEEMWALRSADYV